MTLTESPALDVEAVCTGAALAHARAPWQGLWARLAESPFLSADWHLAWWRHAPEGTPELLIVRRDGEVQALAPLVRVADRLTFSGGELTDRLDVLSVGDDASRALAAAVAARTTLLELRFVPEGARALGAFAEALRASGFAITLEPLVTSPRVTLRESWDAQLATFRKKDRHELRRKLRRLESAGAVSFAYVSAAELEGALDRFVAWHRAAPGDKGAFLTSQREAFFRAAARAGADAGWLRFGELRLDGHAIAAVFALEHAGTLAAYNSSVDPQAAALSPGILLHAHAMRDAIARGLRVYDLLRGDEPYKYDLGATAAPLVRLEARRA